MKKIILIGVFLVRLFCSISGAVAANGDSIPIEKMRYQIEIMGEILVFDKDGHRLLHKGDQERKWSFGDEKPLIGNWISEEKNLPSIYIRHEWDLSSDGQLTATIEQYDSAENKNEEQPKFGKLVKKREFRIENFNPITWVLSQDNSKRVIVKFEPVLWADQEPSNVGMLPINSSRMTVFDNKGNLWASRIDNSDGKNVYFGATTYNGSLYISYVPFHGAKEIGTAEKSRIKIKDGYVKLYIESSDLFLPRGVSAKVYGYIDTNKRTDRFSLVRLYGSDNETDFFNNIKK